MSRLSWKNVVCGTSIAAALVLCTTGRSHAFALQRLAEAIDVSRFATGALTPTGDPGDFPLRLETPTFINLSGPSTELRVGIPTACDVTVEVADDAGAPLFMAEMHMPAGWQKIGFSARNATGGLLPNGTYFYTVTADGTSRTTRVVVNR